MYKILFESVIDGSRQSYRLSALSPKEAMEKFSKIFPAIKILSCEKEK